jgi:hypothetical protein
MFHSFVGRTPRCSHSESLYTLAAPRPVRKASVMGSRHVVTRRPRVAGCNEDHWSLLVRSRERSAKLGCSVVTESLALNYSFLVLRRWMALCFGF